MFVIYLSIVCVLLFVIRLLKVMFDTRYSRRETFKRSSGDNLKTAIVIGSGGHTSEMLYLVKALNPSRYSPRLYIMASSDTWSEQKVHECEDDLKIQFDSRKYEVFKIPRSRHVHQSYFSSIFTTIYSTLACIPIIFRSNPDVIICNGPGTCVPICIISFLLRCCFMSNSYIIFVESICRVKSMSLTGKILQWFADEIFVQWPDLMPKCSRAKYIGRVV